MVKGAGSGRRDGKDQKMTLCMITMRMTTGTTPTTITRLFWGAFSDN